MNLLVCKQQNVLPEINCLLFALSRSVFLMLYYYIFINCNAGAKWIRLLFIGFGAHPPPPQVARSVRRLKCKFNWKEFYATNNDRVSEGTLGDRRTIEARFQCLAGWSVWNSPVAGFFTALTNWWIFEWIDEWLAVLGEWKTMTICGE